MPRASAMADLSDSGHPGASSGPRRSARATEAILHSTLDILAAEGYTGLAIEAVAARAGVGKTTIYRRWPTKALLVGEALAKHFDLSAVPDMGDSRRELLAAIRSTVNNYACDWAGAVIPALAAEVALDPAAAVAFHKWFVTPYRAVAMEVLERAIDRGDLPDALDRDAVIDMWTGAVFYRTLIRQTDKDEDDLERLAEQIVSFILNGQWPLQGQEHHVKAAV